MRDLLIGGGIRRATVSHWLIVAFALALAVLTFSVGIGSANAQLPAQDKAVSQETAASQDRFVRGEILVKFNTGTPEREQADIHRRNGGRHKETIRGIDVKVIGVPAGREQEHVDRYKRTSKVEFAELNGVVTNANDPDDPYDNTTSYASSKHGNVMQWGWNKIQAYQAWDQTTGSSTSPVKVAVVDTGIDNSHPDLPTVDAANQKDFVNGDNNAEDDRGHGTHVAGTIGAKTNNTTGVSGTNWNVSLLAAKALNSSGSGSVSTVSNGITWSADQGAKAINLSLGGDSSSTTLESAVNYAWNKGAVLACSAGNSGSSTQSYPAAYTNCIAVAATDENDQKASFSNYGSSWVDVAAPGVKILSTMPDTTVTMNGSGYYTTYDSLNGTSMAAPHVAGLAGLVSAKGTCDGTGSALAGCVRNEIESKVDSISGTGTYWSKGRINAYNSVGGSSTTQPPPDATPPETTITSGPSGTVNSSTATFAFSSSESGSTFECRLDGGAWIACPSPKEYTGLSNGSHTFEVRATDSAGNVDSSPASGTWTVDTTTTTGDTTAPSVTGNSPTGESVSRLTNVTATFSEDVDGVTVDTFMLTQGTTAPSSTTKITSGTSVSYDQATKTAKLDPYGSADSSLKRCTWYTAKVTSGVKDKAGNPAVEKVWSFKTKGC